MDVYLMQHGAALDKEEDPQRPLSPAGVEQVRSAAAGMKALGLTFDLIAASPKRRSQQTAALVAERLRYPYSDILTTAALLPKADPGEIMVLLADEKPAGVVLLVGHLPHLAVFASRLTGGAELKFENAGLACLEQAAERSPVKSVLPHRFLRALAAGKT